MSKKNLICLISILVLSLLIRIFFMGSQDLLIEEAYYWNYGIHPDFGYIDHPPLVGLLIKLSVKLLGLNEFSVRAPALLSWFVMAYFSYQWAELIRKGAGLYALLLVSILPFFTIFSIFMTPDSPFMACWSAGLYMLYRALCCKESKAWYYAGIAIGFGLLAKYTMILLILTTGIYLLVKPEARRWFLRKEPYIALVIALCIFSPVIYWNATHEWISFIFQSTRRFQDSFHFTFHFFLGLLVLFLTPLGVFGLGKLLKKYTSTSFEGTKKTIDFFRYYTLVPLAFFGFFSLTHEIKFDWIGPMPLALIPWLALLMQNKIRLLHQWFVTAFILLFGYVIILTCLTFGRPEALNQALFNKQFSWSDLTQQLYTVADQFKAKGEIPVFVPIEGYGIASELVFYQEKAFKKNKAFVPFAVHGADIFGFNSLMFKIWGQSFDLHNKAIILVGKTADACDNPSIRRITTPLSPVVMFWGHSQGKLKDVRQFYYQVVRLNSEAS